MRAQAAPLAEFDVKFAQRAGWKWTCLHIRRAFSRLDAATQESEMRTQVLGTGFEGLEERLMLAGNVISALAAGVLVLDGDGLANQVQLTVASNGQMTATGLSGTTINGVASVNFGVVDTLTVNGGAGDDKISLTSTAAVITDDVTIDGGAGNDFISITGRFGADLVLDGGADLDTINVIKATVAVDIDLDSGDGNDKVTLSGSTPGRDVFIQTGLGNDYVTVDGTAVFRDLSLEDTGGNNSFRITNSSTRGDIFVGGELGTLGAGNDALVMNGVTAGVRAGITATGSIALNFGNGNNLLSMTNSKSLGTLLGEGINVTTGTGNDVLGIVGSQSANSISIDTGAGGDRVELTRFVITGTGPLDISTGAGEDSVKLDQVLIGGIGDVDTGLDNDILKITNSRFTGEFDAVMGDGNDIAYLGSNFYASTGSSVDGGLGIDAATVGSNSPFNTNVRITFELIRAGNL